MTQQVETMPDPWWVDEQTNTVRDENRLRVTAKQIVEMRAKFDLLLLALAPVISEIRDGAQFDARWEVVEKAYDDALPE